MTNLHNIITESRCDDPSDTAWKVIDVIGLPKKFHELLYPLIRAECIRQHRYATRIAERVGIEGEESPVNEQDEPTVSRTSFLAERFFNGSDWVVWSLATVADHEGRIEFQASLKRGLDKDIKRHRWAIDQIKSHNVTCLAEISDLVVA